MKIEGDDLEAPGNSLKSQKNKDGVELKEALK